jgi:hypothetical protein
LEAGELELQRPEEPAAASQPKVPLLHWQQAAPVKSHGRRLARRRDCRAAGIGRVRSGGTVDSASVAQPSTIRRPGRTAANVQRIGGGTPR